jgi:hypothetical protein
MVQIMNLRRKKMKNLLIIIVLILFTGSSYVKADWEPPCNMGCTGDWSTEQSKDYPVASCFGCSVRMFWHEREAVCLGLTEFQYQITSIWFIGCSSCELNWGQLMNIGISGLINDIITSAPSGTISYSPVYLQSCWSPELFGPHPKMQPCLYQPDCCRYRYTVEKDEEGYITYLDEEIILPGEECKDEGEINCYAVCNPNGYLYGMKRDNSEEPVNMLNGEVYPNPNEGNIRMEFNGSLTGNLELIIFDNTGNIVYKRKLEKNSEVLEEYLNMENFSKGLYNFGLYQDKNKVSAGSFIIK